MKPVKKMKAKGKKEKAPIKKARRKSVKKPAAERLSSGPTYLGPPVEITFSHGTLIKRSCVIAPWKQSDIDARSTAKRGTPLIVVYPSGEYSHHKAIGFVMLKTTIKAYVLHDGGGKRIVSSSWFWDCVGTVWALATMPNHQFSRKMLEYMANIEYVDSYDDLIEAMKKRFTIFDWDNPIMWWNNPTVVEFDACNYAPEPKAKKRKVA